MYDRPRPHALVVARVHTKPNQGAGSTTPYKDSVKARETKRLSAQRRRALAPKATREDELEANRERNSAKRDATRPVPITDADFLKEAARFGPAKEGPLDRSSLKGVSTGLWIKSDSSSARRISISETDDHPGAVAGIGTLESIVLGKGYDYNPSNTYGEPYWWRDDTWALSWGRWMDPPYKIDPPYLFGAPFWWLDDPRPNYRGEERRWALYSLSFRRRNWSPAQGKAAEARGLEIATTLQGESQDVRWVAGWLRDGKTHVPPRSAKRLTPERVAVAMRRLKKLGLLTKIGAAFRIQ